MTRRLLRAGILVAAGLAVAGCGSSGTKVTETRDGRVTVKGTGGRETATVQSDGASVTYGIGAVPKGFPAAVPLPTGPHLGTTAAGTRGDTQFFTLTYLPTTTATKALTAYGSQLTGAGFTVSDGPGASFDATNGTWKVRAVAGTGSEPTLAVSVTNA